MRAARTLRARSCVGVAAALGVAFLACLTPASAMDCVAYARATTGFALIGDAWRWWDAAAGSYARGRRPQPGAVMVFAQTNAMRLGHVAVVRAVRGPREILIDQANWETGSRRGEIEVAVSVIDVSRHNDWSDVRVEWQRTQSYGRVNPVRGFIYPNKRYFVRFDPVTGRAIEVLMADHRWGRRGPPRG